ncbi:MAG: hypothetical protein H6737_17090 [Alphaproteobacteria bacterium]|nr:hypothetical protein [Alphaproteobacteria bacterium]
MSPESVGLLVAEIGGDAVRAVLGPGPVGAGRLERLLDTAFGPDVAGPIDAHVVELRDARDARDSRRVARLLWTAARREGLAWRRFERRASAALREVWEASELMAAK